MTDIDLTPFGFTPTENLAYGALLELGPSSGYALAKRLSIARANAYQALNGLVAKGAAVRTNEQPQRYRAERPDAILARAIDVESSKLDTLERQIAAVGPGPGVPIVPVRGTRGVVNTALRTAAREPGDVTCLGPGELLSDLNPAWRRRAADGRRSIVWLVAEAPIGLPTPLAGLVDEARVTRYFGAGVFLLLAADVALVVSMEDEDAVGYWTSDPTICGTARAALVTLTGVAGS